MESETSQSSQVLHQHQNVIDVPYFKVNAVRVSLSLSLFRLCMLSAFLTLHYVKKNKLVWLTFIKVNNSEEVLAD